MPIGRGRLAFLALPYTIVFIRKALRITAKFALTEHDAEVRRVKRIFKCL